jgi:hypothetical protein
MADWPMSSRGSSSSSPEPGRRSGGGRGRDGRAGLLRATQARELAKINTPVTRTRRHSPAHGGTIARIGV